MTDEQVEEAEHSEEQTEGSDGTPGASRAEELVPPELPADELDPPEPEHHELPDADTAVEVLRMMTLIRRFEEEAQAQYQRAKIGGFLHLAPGEEATIVGMTSVMRDSDYLIGPYRTHGHVLARGTEPRTVMAELFGRVDGAARGRGGSMHMFDLERRFMGGYGIVGGHLPLGAGLGLACRYTGSEDIVVCTFGDGASNTGNFGETMNMAALWELPVVFLVENNLYGMGTSLERHSAVTDLSTKAEGYGISGERVDGMDVLAMRECMARHIDQVREGDGPTLVEAFTYRFRGHSAADPEVYRDKDEVSEWRDKRDPVNVFSTRLIGEDVLSEDDYEQMRDEVEEIVKDAVDFAGDSPEPELDSLYDYLFHLDDDARGWHALDLRTPDPHPGERDRPDDELAQQLREAGAAYGGQPQGPSGGSEDEG